MAPGRPAARPRFRDLPATPGAPPLVKPRLLAFTVPAPTFRRFTPLVAVLGIVIAPDTVSVVNGFRIRDVSVAVVDVNDTVPASASAVTVTLCPFSIVTV